MGFDQILFFIYFIYGLAFLGMGVAMAMEVVARLFAGGCASPWSRWVDSV